VNIVLGLSTEERNLYNPAYIGAILYHSIRESQGKNEIGLHCSLPYLLIPLAISGRYSSILPTSVATPIAGWVADNEGSLLGFSEAVSSYIDVVNSAAAFLLERGAICISNDGFYRIENDQLAKLPSRVKKDMSFKKAFLNGGLLGRWFSEASSTEIIYTQFGVMP
jgi:hypothetical protein